MRDIIIVFRNPDTAGKIKSILMRRGFDVLISCSTGARVLAEADDLGSGIVVCGYQLKDMLYEELAQSLPASFKVLLVASHNSVDETELADNTVFLPLPLKTNDLILSLDEMLDQMRIQKKKERAVKKGRSEEEQKVIDEAKDILMKRNGMTEPEAHRYLQKCAMDSGNNLKESAEMIIMLSKMS